MTEPASGKRYLVTLALILPRPTFTNHACVILTNEESKTGHATGLRTRGECAGKLRFEVGRSLRKELFLLFVLLQPNWRALTPFDHEVRCRPRPCRLSRRLRPLCSAKGVFFFPRQARHPTFFLVQICHLPAADRCMSITTRIGVAYALSLFVYLCRPPRL
jgi:hypothetical protein